MKIEVGAVWAAPGGGSRSYSVTYEESDLAELQQGKGMSRGKAVDHLSRQAEMLVITYVWSQGGIGEGTYRARMEELRRANQATQSA